MYFIALAILPFFLKSNGSGIPSGF